MSPHHLRRGLEAELAAEPDDLATHAAYADLLDEEGDPRGEFIQVQLRLEDPSLDPRHRGTLRLREQQLLAAHQREWLGALAPHLLDGKPTCRFRFRRGWLDTLHVDLLTFPFSRALARAPEARLLRALAVEDVRDDDYISEQYSPEPADNIPENTSWAWGWYPLLGSPSIANLRHCRLGKDAGDEHTDFSGGWASFDELPRLVRGMPRIEELRLFALWVGHLDFYSLPTFTRLRVLQLYHLETVYRLDLLAANPACANLTELLCHPHHINSFHDEDVSAGFREDEGVIPLSVVVPLLHSPHMRRLRHLRLRLSSMGDEGCLHLVESGMLAQLERLDLRHGRVTDRGARILADCLAAAGLKWIDLDRNYLSSEGIGAIRSLGVPCRVDDQHDPDALSDEPSVDDEYLTEGDFE